MLKKLSVTAALAFSIAGVAHAESAYSFSTTRIDGNNKQVLNQDGDLIQATHSSGEGAGTVENVSTSYDAASGLFSWSVTADSDLDAFWLVVNDGSKINQTDTTGNPAVIYFDRQNDNRISVFNYTPGTGHGDGVNRNGETLASSIRDDSFVISSSSSSDNGLTTASFTLDASVINAAAASSDAEGSGIVFGENIGIWLDIFTGGDVGYDKDTGALTSFEFCHNGYYDLSNASTTTTVAAPTPSAAFAGLAGMAMVLRRRRRGEAVAA